MGLTDYKRYKLKKSIEEIFRDEYGVTPEDMKYLPEALKIIKLGQTQPIKPTEKEIKDFKEKFHKPITAEDIVKQFAGDTEEFYPNGKPESATNN